MNNQDFKINLKRRSFNLARMTIALADKFPNKRSAWIIADQLIRAVTSIGANIVEAQAASSNKDFVNFLNHALKSGNESKYWYCLAKDLDEKLISFIDPLLQETDELVKILGSSLIKLRRK